MSKGGKPSEPKKQKVPSAADYDQKLEGENGMSDIPVVHADKFDLDAYIERYQGITRVRRLMFIGERCPELQLVAFRRAIDELKTTLNTLLYVECVSRARELLGDKLGDDWGLDNKWKGIQERKAQDTIVRLEGALASSKRDEGREPVRKAFNALAQFFVERGEYPSALTKFLETKECCTTGAQTLQACIDLIKTSIHLGTMTHVKNQSQRAQSLPELKGDLGSKAILDASNGLFQLKSAQYRLAAQAFLATNDAISKHNDIISLADVAVYGCITALASYSRRDLKSVTSTESFKRMAEQAPVWKKIIADFHANHHAACFAQLESLRSDLYLDMYLAPHVDKLISKIRDRALMEYFKPFVSVKIPLMAESFKVAVPELEKQLVGLIAEGKISARIDSANKILYARHTDERSSTFEKALTVGDKYIRDCKSMLMRMSLIENDFVVRHPELEKRIKAKREQMDKDKDDKPNAMKDVAM